MATACSVCAHSAAEAINAALIAGSPSVLRLAAEHSLSRDALNYHRRAHIARPVTTRPHPNSRAAKHTGAQDRARQRFLNAFARTGNMSAAAKVAGVGRTTVYTWTEHDPAFSAAFQAAGVQATEALEGEAWRRAKDGIAEPVYQHGKMVGTIQRYSDQLLMFLLRARSPEKYRDNVTVSVQPIIKAVAGFDPADVL